MVEKFQQIGHVLRAQTRFEAVGHERGAVGFKLLDLLAGDGEVGLARAAQGHARGGLGDDAAGHGLALGREASVAEVIGQHLPARIEDFDQQGLLGVRLNAGQIRADVAALALHGVADKASFRKGGRAALAVAGQLERRPKALHHRLPVGVDLPELFHALFDCRTLVTPERLARGRVKFQRRDFPLFDGGQASLGQRGGMRGGLQNLLAGGAGVLAPRREQFLRKLRVGQFGRSFDGGGLQLRRLRRQQEGQEHGLGGGGLKPGQSAHGGQARAQAGVAVQRRRRGVFEERSEAGAGFAQPSQVPGPREAIGQAGEQRQPFGRRRAGLRQPA